MENFTYSEELYHFGIQGMKWGIRRYQNEDGTLTEEGRKRYQNQARKVEMLQIKAINHREKNENKNQYKVAKLNRQVEKYKLKRAKTLKAASRPIAPLKPSVAVSRMAKYELKSEKAALKAQKLIEKMAKEKVTADKYEVEAKNLIAKIQKEYANVKMSELETIPKKVGWGTASMGLARSSQELGVKSRESDRYPGEKSTRHYGRQKLFSKAEKAKPGSLSIADKMELDNYITTVNERYGHDSSVTKEEFDRANRLYNKHFGRKRS